MKRLILLCGILLAGCATEDKSVGQPNPIIPRTALPADDRVGRIFFQATEDGVIYVYDCETADVLLSTPIKQNQRFVFDPERYITTIEGKAVSEQHFDRHHEHRIYFDPHGKVPTPPATTPS